MPRLMVAFLLFSLSRLSHALTFGTGCADVSGQEILVRGCPVTCTIFVGPNDADEPVSVQNVHYVVHHADGDAVVEGSGTPITLQPGDSQVAFPIEITANASDTDRLTMTAIGELTIEYPVAAQPFEDSFPDAVTLVDTGICPSTTTTVTEPPAATTTTTEPPVASRPECARASGHGVGLARKCK